MSEASTSSARLNSQTCTDVLARLRRIEGQVRGVSRMVEEHCDCRELVMQLSAIKAAIASLNIYVAESYARECLCDTTVDSAELSQVLEVLKTAR